MFDTRRLSLMFFAALCCFCSVSAVAQEESAANSYSGEGDVERLCNYLEAVAASERVLLVSPEIFGRVGVVQGGLDSASDTPVAFEPSARVTAGLRYSFNDLVRGNLRTELAKAECARAAASARIEGFVDANEEIDMTRAYEAQLVAAEAALTDARRMLSTLKKSVETNRATELELRAMRARINRYENLAHDTRTRLASLEVDTTDAPEAELEALVADVVESEVALEEERSNLRKSGAWDVQLAGGYDQTFGYDSALPVFATLSLAFNFGRLLQGEHEERAVAARRAMFEENEDSWDKRLERVADRIERVSQTQAAKLMDVRSMLVDIRNRRDEMARIGTETARRYADQLALDAWDLEIERAFLYSHLEVLKDRLEKLGREVPSSVEEALSASDMGAVDIRTIDFTKGGSDGIGSATIRVNDAKSRAYFEGTAGDSAKITFTYEGPSAETSALGSGQVRRQIGLKLKAQNGCNLLYVMWRIDPPDGIVVSVKRNDGATNHLECGTRGYSNLEPDTTGEVPAVLPGSQHTLEAALEGKQLVVRADGAVVWQKEFDPSTLPFDGPAGIRTDNGIFQIVAEAPRAVATGKPSK